jgi:hypothetical protein
LDTNCLWMQRKWAMNIWNESHLWQECCLQLKTFLFILKLTKILQKLTINTKKAQNVWKLTLINIATAFNFRWSQVNLLPKLAPMIMISEDIKLFTEITLIHRNNTIYCQNERNIWKKIATSLQTVHECRQRQHSIFEKKVICDKNDPCNWKQFYLFWNSLKYCNK